MCRMSNGHGLFWFHLDAPKRACQTPFFGSSSGFVWLLGIDVKLFELPQGRKKDKLSKLNAIS